MNTIGYLTKLIDIGRLSVELRAAESTVASAKHDYHAAWRKFEVGDDEDEFDAGLRVPDEYRVSQGHPQWEAAQAATAAHYKAYQAAKRQAYNIKRRWLNACRKAI